MGHDTAEATVIADTNDLNKIVNTAVRRWYDEDAGRWSDARPGTPKLYPLMTPNQINVLLSAEDFIVTEDGYTAIFPITDSVPVKHEKRMKIQAPGKLVEDLKRGDWEARRTFRKLVADLVGKDFSDCEVLKFPASRKPIAETTEGKAITVYNVYGVDNRRLDLLASCVSQAAARAKALELAGEEKLSAGNYIKYETFEVRPVIERESGDKAVVRVVRPTAETVSVEVKVATERFPADAKVTHYRVMFDYHH